MTEEKETQAQPEEDTILKALNEYLELHKKQPLRALFVCAVTDDKDNKSTSAGLKGTEYEILGALDLAHTNLKMDWIMQAKAKELMAALASIVAKHEPEEEPVIH